MISFLIDDIQDLLRLLSQVLEVHADLRPDLFIHNTTKFSYEDIEEILKDENKPIYVYDKNGVKGYVFLEIRNRVGVSNMPDEKYLYIEDLCVEEESRKQGIGKALLDYAVEFAKEEKCERIVLNLYKGNENAEKLYKDFGFTTRCEVLEMKVEGN